MILSMDTIAAAAMVSLETDVKQVGSVQTVICNVYVLDMAPFVHKLPLWCYPPDRSSM